MKTFLPYFTIGILLYGPVCSEMRIWEDRDGNRYKAEFVREFFNKLTIRDVNGKEYRFTVDDLSEHDQKYIRVMVPPVMEIGFLKKTRIKPKPPELSDDDNDTITILSAAVAIAKKSKRPFTSRLTAEVYLIAGEVDGENYVLLDRFESGFLFAQEDIHEFKTEPIEVTAYTEYTNQRRGEEFLGYLVAVSDARGNIVQISTDIDWLSDKVKRLRDLYLRGRASRYIRHFNRDVQKTEVPRPVYYSSRPR